MAITIKPIVPEDELRARAIFIEAFDHDKTFRWCFDSATRNYQETLIAFSSIPFLFHQRYGWAMGAYMNNELVGFLYATSSLTHIDTVDSWWDEMARTCGERAAQRMKQWDQTTGQIQLANACLKVTLVGVSQYHQGLGIGGALMAWLDQQCIDNPVYEGIQLDTGKRKNVEWYERLGYETRLTKVFAGDTHHIMFKARERCAK